MRLLINEKLDGYMLKTTTATGQYYLIKSATSNKSFWNGSISYVNVFQTRQAALNKLYRVIQKLPEYAFYDEESLYDIEDESDIGKSKFAGFYITDSSGNVIENISEEVKQHLLSDETFISNVLEEF